MVKTGWKILREALGSSSPVRWFLRVYLTYIGLSLIYFVVMIVLNRKSPRYVVLAHFLILGWFCGHACQGLWRAHRAWEKSRKKYRRAVLMQIHMLAESGLFGRDREPPAMEEILLVASTVSTLRLLEPKWASNEIVLLEKWLARWGVAVREPKKID